MTTLVMKNLVCGMADILWKEEQDKIFVQLKVSDQTMTIIQLCMVLKIFTAKALIQQISYCIAQGFRVECAEITMQR